MVKENRITVLRVRPTANTEICFVQTVLESYLKYDFINPTFQDLLHHANVDLSDLYLTIPVFSYSVDSTAFTLPLSLSLSGGC